MHKHGSKMQYQDNPPDPDIKLRSVTTTKEFERELNNLRSQIKTQNDQILSLQRDLRRIRNELRVAINQFNLTHGG
jgi:molecular chaperone GrpE (heat shock protein)